MNQLSFASLDYAARMKLTKRDVFLVEMAAVVRSMRKIAGLELGRDAIPGKTTILKFRHPLERHS